MTRAVVRGILCVVLCSSIGNALPNQLAQEGLLLTQDGRPLDGEHDLTIRLYARERGGEAVFEEVHRRVALVDGYYVVAVGALRALSASVFLDNEALFLTIAVDEGEELAPRTPIRKVPASFVADVALSISGPVDTTSVSIGGVPVINEDGEWVGEPGGLVGPEGPQGPPGPPGRQGGDGSPDTPAQVRQKLLQVDGAGSGIDADLLDGIDSTRFMRTDRDTGTTGGLSVAGRAVFEDRVQVADALVCDGPVVGTKYSVGNREVIDSEGRWVGSSVGLDADLLDGFDSDDFLRADALERLDLRGGAVENVGRITPGDERARVRWVQTTPADFAAGHVQDADLATTPGDIRLTQVGGRAGGAVRVLGEAGIIEDIRHDWRTIRLQGRYEDPVVVATGATVNGDDGVTVRARNIGNDRFDIRLEEWDCEDGAHPRETLGWLVMERGHWDFGGGLEVEAGSVRTDNTPEDGSWERISFDERFSRTPVMASILNSNNGGDSTTVMLHGITSSRFQIMMQEDLWADGHTTEDLGFVAISPGGGLHNGRRWAAGSTGRRITHGWTSIDFPDRFPQTPALVVDSQTEHGGNSFTMRTRGHRADRFEMRVHESCPYGGSAGGHTTEDVGWYAFEDGFRFLGNPEGGGPVEYAEEGSHTSQIADFGSRVSFGSFFANATLQGEAIGVRVEVSNDRFENIAGRVAITLRDGEDEYEESANLPDARYARVEVILRTRDSQRTPALHEYGLDVTVGGTIDFGGANLINIGKINANLYDPVYRIDGEFHATYLPENPTAVVQTSGVAVLRDGVARVPLAKAKRGTPEWLFAQAAEEVHAIVTPMGPASLYVESVSPEALVVRSFSGDANVRFAYQLTGRRVDMAEVRTTHYQGDPAEVTTAIDPVGRGIWHRGVGQ